MSTTSRIEWTDRTWNPTRGCSVVSPGCHSCYAMKQAHRFSGPGRPYGGLTKMTKAGPQWTGEVRTIESALREPVSWRTPARVFVNSMSDLFHVDVPWWFIDEVFATMALAPQHTFQILTKRPEVMREYLARPGKQADIAVAVFKRFSTLRESDRESRRRVERWPLPNVWLGVSAENQEQADTRIPELLRTPAAVRFISAEPLLGRLDLDPLWCGNCSSREHIVFEAPAQPWCLECDSEAGSPGWLDGLDWVIVGGESGPGARPCAIEWVERIVDECRAAGVPVFVKQLGAYVVSEERTAPADVMSNPAEAYRNFRAPNGEVWAWRAGLAHRKGGNPEEWPMELRVREFPEVRA